jgi:RNA polymerase sigma-70 factor (ECF subfamily)
MKYRTPTTLAASGVKQGRAARFVRSFGISFMSPSQPLSTSTSLLALVKQRDPDAWVRLTKIYGPTVYVWCRRAGLQPADSADVAQGVFGAVAANIDRFRLDRPEDTFRGWLWSIFRSKLMDFYRDRKHQPEIPGDSALEGLLPTMNCTADSVCLDSSAENAAELVQRALAVIKADFRENTWQAFWLTAVLGEATSDVAASLHMTPAAVCMSRSRVLRRLRETLQGLGLFPEG